MKLKSGSTYWTQRDGPTQSHAPLNRNASCDVAIVGGGVTGALVAHFLVKAGMHILLVDRRELATGSTAASTGLLQYEIDTSLVDLTKQIGWSRASRAYALSERSLHDFPGLVAELPDSCGFTARQSLYLASKPHDAEEFREEFAARRACGLAVHFLTAAEIHEKFAIDRPAALISPLAFQIDPYRFARQLMKRAIANGLEAFGRTEVTTFIPGESSVLLRTKDNLDIRASHVVFATGYETPEFLPIKVRLKSTFALAARPPDRPVPALEQCLIWESARPYLYLRMTPHGDVIMGGEDIDCFDPSTRDALIPEKTQSLANKFESLFPGNRIYPTVSWAGTFAETSDGLPFIGTSPLFPRGYFALGYGGNGITFSLIAAEMIRDLIQNRPNPNADLFRLNR